MSFKTGLRKLLLGLILTGASLMGVPMKAQEIEEILVLMNQPRIEIVVEQEDDEP